MLFKKKDTAAEGGVAQDARQSVETKAKAARSGQTPSSPRPAKQRLINWKGLLADADRTQRIMTLALIAVLTMSMSICQLGFLGIGLPGQYVGFAAGMLVPIAATALLFGTELSTAEGLYAGLVTYLHSLIQPLDYYESVFINPLSSIVVLTLCGFVMGLLFAAFLRNNPTGWRRVVRIAIACVLVAVIYSIVFIISSIFQIFVLMTVGYIYGGASFGTTSGANAAFHVGDVVLQFFVNLALLAFTSLLTDVLARFGLSRPRPYSLSLMFRTWLLVGVAITFMVTSAITFGVTTERQKGDALTLARAETDYLERQIRLGADKLGKLLTFLQGLGHDLSAMTDEQVEDASSIVALSGLLDGYSVDYDGLLVVLSDGEVLLSDDEALIGQTTSGIPAVNIHTMMLDDAIASSAKNGSLIPVIYDPHADNGPQYANDGVLTTQIGYLYARQVQVDGMDAGDVDVPPTTLTVVMLLPSSLVFASRSGIMLATGFSASMLLLVVFLMASRLLNDMIMRRIDEANRILAQITDGDLGARVEIHGSKEFDSLSTGVNTTVDALKGWISEAESRMEQELATAKSIQENALPRVFPPYPDILKFDIYASMHAAKEVGGDFYDFFLMGDDSDGDAGKLAFVIADVSGKGVPGALFMMTSKTQIRNFISSGVDLGEAIENANHNLCEGNDAGMFVTAFVGVIDYGTGHVEYVNAGHNPPLLWREGQWHWMKEKSGLPLGLFDGLPYTQYSIDLQAGDQFFLYTDGVTEAMSTSNELYGEDRLEALLNTDRYMHPRELIDAVGRDVARHATGAEQSDDITMLSLEFGVAPEQTHAIVLPADVRELDTARQFVHAELNQRLCPIRAQTQFDVAFEELFVNVCHYAYPDATPDHPGEVRVLCSYSAEPPSVLVKIIDDGIPFDPLAKPDAVTPDNVMDIPIGGLGILMAKQSVDEMSYERDGESNVVTILKKW